MPIASLPLRLLMRAVGIAPANVAEATGTPAIGEDLVAQQVTLHELHIGQRNKNLCSRVC